MKADIVDQVIKWYTPLVGRQLHVVLLFICRTLRFGRSIIFFGNVLINSKPNLNMLVLVTYFRASGINEQISVNTMPEHI